MSNINVMRKNLGPVTAYKYAVQQGYTGTEQEFAALMASYATVAETATQAADDAVDAKTAAEAAQAAAEAAAEQAEGAIEVDDTLSVKGKAADAKKTGDRITGLKVDLNNIESVFEKDLYSAVEINGTLRYENYAINEQGILQVVSGYSVYRYALANYIGHTIHVNANSNAPYKCCFATNVGITNGFISFADGLCIVPPNTASLYITTQDASNDSVFLLSKQKIKETECEFISIGKNLFDKSTAIIGKYVNQTNGSIDTNANFFASDFIEVESGEQYVFSCSTLAGSRYATYDESKLFIDGGLITTTDSITMPTNAKYVRISSYNTELNSTQFEKGSSATQYTEYGLKIDEKLLPTYDNGQKSIIGLGFAKVSGNLTNGDTLTLFKNNMKKNHVYSFLAKITSFGSIVIGHGTTEYESSYLTITSTNADYTKISPSAVTTQHTHGLTIAGFIYVVIEVLIGEANVTITSSSGTFNFTTEWNGCSNASPYVKCISGTLTDCEFTLSSNDLTKSIWYFGDSYVNFRTNNRWTYYMNEKGWLENFLLNGFGGEGSANAYSALQAMMPYGKPEAIIWGMGMNDSSDSTSAPSSTWKTYVDNFIQMCTINEITPILCTIPTVPSISHEQKNQYVRESGYRYIDFAKVVGAQPDGTWYSDMLSSDNVHPDTLGAIALYERAITDVPELTYGK